ncbi:peptidase inhibitor 16 [Poecilia formosa]|nr:PREDICTED: peptidase inhibitor 16-like [Poecilia formosa]
MAEAAGPERVGSRTGAGRQQDRSGSAAGYLTKSETLLADGTGSKILLNARDIVAEKHMSEVKVFSVQKWDPNLKLVAESYAAKCIWNHNPALDDTGENLFVSSGPLDLRDALEKWFLEHLDFDYQNNSCDEDKMCGHYTQMVWADTHRVGCAFHLCNTMEGLDWERVSFLVCNYFPAGNYEDQRPYVEGDWCSSCPENLQECENNLCVPDVEEEEVTIGSSDLPPPRAAASPSSTNETITAVPAATTPSTPSMTPTAGSAADSPPPGTAEQEVFFSPTSRAPQEEEEAGKSDEEEKREERVIRKPEIWQKTFPQSNISAGSGSVCAAPVLLAGLAGLLTLWL